MRDFGFLRGMRISLSALSLVACLGLQARVANADGGILPALSLEEQSIATIGQPEQKAYIRWDGRREDMTLVTKFEGPAKDMVWLLPVPSEPTVEKGEIDTVLQKTLGIQAHSLPQYYPIPRYMYRDREYKEADPFAIFLDDGKVHNPRFFHGTVGALDADSVAAWRKSIGVYDVALLAPQGAKSVISWLKENGFEASPQAEPIIAYYVEHNWWIIASKIRTEEITEKLEKDLAHGTVDPLKVSFAADRCVYPMRLTAISGGKVEVVLSIEAPRHFVPETLAEGPWEISFGGPVREVDNYRSSHYPVRWDHKEPRYEEENHRMTALRRTFHPEEMSDDIYLRPVETYAPYLRQEKGAFGLIRFPNEVILQAAAMNDVESLGLILDDLEAVLQGEPMGSARRRTMLIALGTFGAAGKGDSRITECLKKYGRGDCPASGLDEKIDVFYSLAFADPEGCVDFMLQQLGETGIRMKAGDSAGYERWDYYLKESRFAFFLRDWFYSTPSGAKQQSRYLQVLASCIDELASEIANTPDSTAAKAGGCAVPFAHVWLLGEAAIRQYKERRREDLDRWRYGDAALKPDTDAAMALWPSLYRLQTIMALSGKASLLRGNVLVAAAASGRREQERTLIHQIVWEDRVFSQSPADYLWQDIANFRNYLLDEWVYPAAPGNHNRFERRNLTVETLMTFLEGSADSCRRRNALILRALSREGISPLYRAYLLNFLDLDLCTKSGRTEAIRIAENLWNEPGSRIRVPGVKADRFLHRKLLLCTAAEQEEATALFDLVQPGVGADAYRDVLRRLADDGDKPRHLSAERALERIGEEPSQKKRRK